MVEWQVDERSLLKVDVVKSMGVFAQPVNTVCFSEDCQRVFVSSNDATLQVYSIEGRER